MDNGNVRSTNSISLFLDKTAIGLSAICAIHCLMLPVALTLIPILASLPMGDESFHLVLVFAVLPTSVIALSIGCRRHRQWQIFMWGGAGLSVLIFTAFLGHDLLGERFEKWATVLGATLVATSHLMNFRRCQAADCQH